jgi:hypothetical protein
MKLYIFRAVPLPIIKSLFTVHSALVSLQSRRISLFYIEDYFTFMWPCIVTNFFMIKPTRCTNFSNLWNILFLLESCLRPVWHIPVPSVQWIISWWWAEELPNTCRVLCQNKLEKLVHLVGFILKKFVTMHGHINVKYIFNVEQRNYSTL